MTPARVRITVRARDGNREVSITREVPEGRDLATIAKLAYHTAQLELEASRPRKDPFWISDPGPSLDELTVRTAKFACMACGNVTDVYLDPFATGLSETPECYHCRASPTRMRRVPQPCPSRTAEAPTLGQILDRGFVS